jgi:hypothetical protein
MSQVVVVLHYCRGTLNPWINGPIVRGQFFASVVHDQKIVFFLSSTSLPEIQNGIMPVLRYYIWMVASARCAV